MINPYIAGAPVTEARMFFGREDVFEWIEHSLTGRYVDHILVIHGQRRVGKTSVLKQLPHRLPERYIPVFFDLQGRTHTTLDRFLWWLAREIVRVLKQDRSIVVPLPEKLAFAEDPEYFDGQFLPSLQPQLGDHNLLLTFDEFDALEEAEVKEALARPLVDHLRQLMGHEGLNFIFSIGSSGRKLENMQASYTEFFKAALYKKISFFGQEDARSLITRPVEGLLEYDRGAANQIYEITSGHPYFTQLVCHELFSYCQKTNKRRVCEADVQAVLDDVVERGTVNLKFVWDEASDLEKWVLAGLAHLEGKVEARALADFLRHQRVRFSNQDLDLALLHLREKDVLTDANRFVIDLMRIWLQRNRPLERVREELTEVSPIANRYIEIGLEYKDSGLYDKAIESFREALGVNPDNIQAQVSIASVYLDQKTYDKAVTEFQKALAIDEEEVAARAGLCEAHLALGDQALARGKVKDAIRSYQEVLAINAEHTEARQRMADIHRRRAEKALADGRDDEALSAFKEALGFAPEDQTLEARYAEVREQKRAKIMAGLLTRAEKEQAAKNWDEAIAILEEALEMAPEDQSLQERLAAAGEGQRAARLEAILVRADQATDAGRWDDAVAALDEYLSLEPGDAAVQERLVEARRRQRESQLNSLRARARSLAKAEKWEEALAVWRDYLALEPEDREAVQAEVKEVEEGREMARAYAEAQAAMAKKAYGQAIDHLKQIIAKDENYRDASTMLAQAIALRRGQRPRWKEPRLLGAMGAGAIIITLSSFFALQPTSPLRVALAPPMPTATATPTSTPTPRPTSTTTPTPTLTPLPTPIPLAWHRLYGGEIFPRDTITAIVVDPRDPDVLYVGTYNAGIYKSIDGGLSWQPMHNGLGRAWIHTLVIDPREPRTLYAGTSLGGVYKTTDGGATWQAVNKGIDYLGGWEAVSIVALDPQDSQHLYYTPAFTGIYESVEGGGSWTNVQTSSCPNATVGLVVHTVDSKILFAVDRGDQGCETGMYKSNDAGRTWTFTGPQMQNLNFGALEIDSQDGELLYALGRDQLYVSSDGGKNWSQPPQIGCPVLAIDPQDGAVAYCGAGNSILKTTDGGQTWQPLAEVVAGDMRAISVSPHDRVTLLVGGSGLYESTDGGVSWVERSSGLGQTRLDLRLDPSDSSTLYAYSPEGPCRLYRSSDRGRSWELVTDQGCGLAFDAGGEILYLRRGDALLRSQDKGKTWESLALPKEECSGVAAHPRQAGTVYALYWRNQPPYIYVSSDGGKNWQSTSGMQDICDQRLFFDHDQGQVVYTIGDVQASRSKDGGVTWEDCQSTNAWHARPDSRLAIDPRDSDHLILATRGDGVLVSRDGCQSWEPRNTGLGNFFVNTVAIDPQNPDTLYAGTDGGAYVSYDGGEHWGPVNDGLLGATVVYSIVVDPEDPSNVYAATPYGIFNLESK